MGSITTIFIILLQKRNRLRIEIYGKILSVWQDNKK